jgi:hypothetical protein
MFGRELVATCDGCEYGCAGAGRDAAAGAMGVEAGAGAFAATFFAHPANVMESAIRAAQAKYRDFIQSLLRVRVYRISAVSALKNPVVTVFPSAITLSTC